MINPRPREDDGTNLDSPLNAAGVLGGEHLTESNMHNWTSRWVVSGALCLGACSGAAARSVDDPTSAVQTLRGVNSPRDVREFTGITVGRDAADRPNVVDASPEELGT